MKSDVELTKWKGSEHQCQPARLESLALNVLLHSTYMGVLTRSSRDKLSHRRMVPA